MLKLKRKSYLSILPFLLLSSCTSEPTQLERCIEVNFEKLNFVSKEDRKILEKQNREFCDNNMLIAEDGNKYVLFNGQDDIEENDFVELYERCPRYLEVRDSVNREFDAQKEAIKICNEQGIY